MKLSTKLTAGLLAGATLLAASTPADAQWHHRYYGHRGDRAGLALGAGALGLALGAAIGSSSHRGYYGDGYYGGGYYGRPYAYGYGGYGDGYYAQPYGYGYGSYYAPRRCWTDRQWDDWRGRWRRVRVCDRY
ncbi:hypothetical protein SCH01S_48_00380 [Sphingomonas changbaiensis NBRC 104936]|uniref:Sulfur globule protein n=1 Tax=Sphingomonas changbaiensis NBRC 104936 TaxID=1219043 RepID=A0A0E9MTE0_9SPHN|nr:hypothetical protein [Sphingomonas changbaiensis]GAO40380.1 hypothetical protein SCH01S_48_00380 [Sphingomonas changbaiensis NBRC 104936]